VNVLDLFSGIGGFSLGLERAGMRTVAFCEIDPYARAVLRKHWPDVPCYDDIRTLTAATLASSGIVLDAICGGFPCQDLSYAGKGAGIEGARSGLWSEYARLIGEIRPKYAIMENVTALLSRGLGRVLGDLAALGYDAEWHCIPASAVGAPHERDRVWIVSYPKRQHDTGRLINCIPSKAWSETRLGELVRISSPAFRDEAISTLGGMDDGVSDRVDRLRAIGNAVVPQIPQIFGEAIMQAEGLRA
jgi:DNA (cytosine-5)-methyltransferase 1